jgi:hypothetical protein
VDAEDERRSLAIRLSAPLPLRALLFGKSPGGRARVRAGGAAGEPGAVELIHHAQYLGFRRLENFSATAFTPSATPNKPR